MWNTILKMRQTRVKTAWTKSELHLWREISAAQNVSGIAWEVDVRVFPLPQAPLTSAHSGILGTWPSERVTDGAA